MNFSDFLADLTPTPPTIGKWLNGRKLPHPTKLDPLTDIQLNLLDWLMVREATVFDLDRRGNVLWAIKKQVDTLFPDMVTDLLRDGYLISSLTLDEYNDLARQFRVGYVVENYRPLITERGQEVALSAKGISAVIMITKRKFTPSGFTDWFESIAPSKGYVTNFKLRW